jgi:hypothetical protein
MMWWNTGNKGEGKVYVSEDGAEESLFAAERCGSAALLCVQTGSNYEFRLYNSDHTTLLDKLVVTRASH